MSEQFWFDKWQKNEIGFHQSKANPILVEFFPALSLKKGHRIFLPLCGKTLDIGWLLSQGLSVVGIEMVETAVIQLFEELKIDPEITVTNGLKCYKAPNLDIYVGDIFKLSKEILGPVNAVYDRASMVALPEDVRLKYAQHLKSITSSVPQLLVTYEYDQTQVDGPPFSVSSEEVKKHYENNFKLNVLQSKEVPGGMKGKTSAIEAVWLLQ
jgi:thiopurine S-methyltransferase